MKVCEVMCCKESPKIVCMSHKFWFIKNIIVKIFFDLVKLIQTDACWHLDFLTTFLLYSIFKKSCFIHDSHEFSMNFLDCSCFINVFIMFIQYILCFHPWFSWFFLDFSCFIQQPQITRSKNFMPCPKGGP